MEKFIPKPGQIDYTHARWCPVMNTIVKHGDKFLLMKRSQELNFYPGTWSGVSGFLDDQKSLEGKVQEELLEEAGLSEKNISSITLCGVFDQEDKSKGKTWIVHAVLVEVTTTEIKLDWEAETYVWVSMEEIGTYDLLPGFDEVVAAVRAHLEGTEATL